jgi:hypothetical protein
MNPPKRCAMKTLVKRCYSTCVLVAILLIVSCDDTKKDPCDDTVKPEISISLKAVVHILDKLNVPIEGQNVTVNFYKKPCGAPIKGIFTFNYTSGSEGTVFSNLVIYNLRNSNDEVWIDIHAVNLGNGSAMADSEYVTYKYDDFIPGTPKEVHVYIYRNF